MVSKLLASALTLALLTMGAVDSSVADIVCPEASYCEVVFNRTYPSNSQFAGQPYDYVTVNPNGGESFTNVNGILEGDGLLDIEVRVYVRNCSGEPLVGLAPEQVQLFSEALCICPGGADSDAGTDANGVATFTQALSAGGCTTSLDVYVQGVFICTLRDDSGRTVKVNSFDQAQNGTSPCFTDASDLAGFAIAFGRSASGSSIVGPHICLNVDERFPNIDASDLAKFAAAFRKRCE